MRPVGAAVNFAIGLAAVAAAALAAASRTSEPQPSEAAQAATQQLGSRIAKNRLAIASAEIPVSRQVRRASERAEAKAHLRRIS